ncbi:MAG TPA: lytic murein transglycosylase, partial [Thermoleophilaceae bacterium]|nr:lytic murein transglycosylase [Thermoleophilaceae bacterium]
MKEPFPGHGYVRRSLSVLLVLLLAAVVLAVVLSVPASAQPYEAKVRLADGTIKTVIVDLPPGASLADVAGLVEGEPLALTPLDTPPDPNSPGAPPAGNTPSAPSPAAPNKGPNGDDEQSQPPARERPKSRPKRKRTVSKKRSPRKPKARPKHKRSHPVGGGLVGGGRRSPIRRPDTSPTPSSPGFVDALPGPSTRSGVPNFIIRKFRVPVFLLPIYQAAGIQYGVRWEILAAINEIETDYGRNLNVSTAGAVGWMQFLPSTWRRYGVDGNKDKRQDPYNPVDAVFAAARY